MSYLILNSKFNPFTYSELLQPVAMATQAHQDLENQYAELDANASIWDKLENVKGEEYAYNKYSNYINDLRNQINILSSEGLTPTNRKALLSMKGRYNKEIAPIGEAYNRRLGLIEEQRKLAAQDNTILFDKNASQLSLEDLIKNPQLTYTPISGAGLARQVGTAAKALSRELQDKAVKWKTTMGGQYWEALIRKGYSPEQALSVIMNDKNAPKELTDIVDRVIDSSGIREWNNPELLDRAYNYAKQGIWESIGDTNYQIQNNKQFDYDQQERMANLKASLKGKGNIGENPFYRTQSKTSVDTNKKTYELSKDLLSLGELLKNPNLINKEEIKKVRREKYAHIDEKAFPTGVYEDTDKTYKSHPYKELVNKLEKQYGISVFNDRKEISPKKIEELAMKLDSEVRASAIRNNSYVVNITDNSLIGKTLDENWRSYYRKTGKTGLKEVEKGKVSTADVKEKNLSKFFDSNPSLEYDIEADGFVVNGTIDGKPKSYKLDMELIDTPNRTLQSYHNKIRSALYDKNYRLAADLIDGSIYNNQYNEGIMEIVYNRFNSLAKKQGNTEN